MWILPNGPFFVLTLLPWWHGIFFRPSSQMWWGPSWNDYCSIRMRALNNQKTLNGKQWNAIFGFVMACVQALDEHRIFCPPFVRCLSLSHAAYVLIFVKLFVEQTITSRIASLVHIQFIFTFFSYSPPHPRNSLCPSPPSLLALYSPSNAITETVRYHWNL